MSISGKQMDRLIESALMPGRYISHHADFSFVEELGIVEKQLARLVATDPAQAVSLHETFLAGCYEKAGEIDGSSGRAGLPRYRTARSRRTTLFSRPGRPGTPVTVQGHARTEYYHEHARHPSTQRAKSPI